MALLLLEGGHQVAAFGVRWLGPDPAARVAGAAAEGEYRVLCLGESTTEGFGERSYPEILAQELDRRRFGVAFRVINAGRRAADSTTLVEALPAFLDRYRPHMVVAMVGINDQFYFSGAEALGVPAALQLWLLKSRVYKLATLIASNLGAWLGGGPAAAGPTPDPEHWRAYEADFDRTWELWRRGVLEDPAARFRALIEAARAGAPTDRAPLPLPDAYLRSYYNSHLALARTYLAQGRGERAVELYREAIELHPDSEFFSRALSGVHRELGNAALAERFERRSRDLARRRIPAITRRNLRAIERLLADRGVTFVAMQYPLRSVETLRLLLDDSSRALYVDNEDVFRRALAAEGYDALFIDRVAGDFGHCTERGNRLIAENLIDSVFEPLFAAGSRAARR